MARSIYDSLRRLAATSAPTQEALCRLEERWAPELPPDTVAAGIIADALCAGLDHLSSGELRSIFAYADELMFSEAQDTVATGFVEALVAATSSGKLDVRRIAPYIGPECRTYWREWDKFTGTTTPGLE